LRQRKRNRAAIFGISICCSILLGPALLATFSPRQAYADGGAPNLAYVAGAQKGVGIIDVAQQKVTGGFSIAGNPDMILLSPDGRLLYVTQPGPGRVTALAARTGQVICSAAFPGHPALLALNIDGTVLYVAGINETTILALDSQTCALQRSFKSSEPISWLSAASISTGSALRTQLWVAGSSSLSILDEQGQLLDSIPVPGEPRFLCIPGDLTAYVATRQGDIIAVDMLTYRVFATLLTGGSFGSMDYDAVTGDIYVPDQQHDRVDVLSPVLDGSGLLPQEPNRVIPVSGPPQAVAITSDGAFGFVALGNGKVDMLDIPGRQLVASILVGGEPRFIITGAYPPQDVPAPQLPQPTPASPPIILPLVVAAALLLAGLAGLLWFARRRTHHKNRVQAINQPALTYRCAKSPIDKAHSYL
jgi:DNA-binding beta-propeller fold protein YncE